MQQELGGPRYIRLIWRLARDQRVAPRVKAVAIPLTVLYLLSPIDLLPDFLLGLGQMDDLGVLALFGGMLALLPRLAGQDVLAEHLAAILRPGREGTRRGKPGTPTDSREGPATVVDAAYRVRQ